MKAVFLVLVILLVFDSCYAKKEGGGKCKGKKKVLCSQIADLTKTNVDLTSEIGELNDEITRLNNENQQLNNKVCSEHEKCCEKPKGFSLNFANKGITDYTSVEGMPSLQAVTVCFWMRSSDQNNDGTPVSYATSSSSSGNDFIIFDYSNFRIYVNNKHAGYSSVKANDGQWHHLCFTWENSAGSWNIYKDGVLEKKGSGLSTGYKISAGGLLVLGQEQDKVGGGFDEKQSFVGDMSGVNIWNRVLTEQEISELSKSCNEGEGNVFKWSDFKSGIHGQVQVDEPSTCKAA